MTGHLHRPEVSVQRPAFYTKTGLQYKDRDLYTKTGILYKEQSEHVFFDGVDILGTHRLDFRNKSFSLNSPFMEHHAKNMSKGSKGFLTMNTPKGPKIELHKNRKRLLNYGTH